MSTKVYFIFIFGISWLNYFMPLCLHGFSVAFQDVTNMFVDILNPSFKCPCTQIIIGMSFFDRFSKKKRAGIYITNWYIWLFASSYVNIFCWTYMITLVINALIFLILASNYSKWLRNIHFHNIIWNSVWNVQWFM